MAAWLLAAKAIRDAGVKLDGSIYLTAVPGEIGQEPVDEFQGKDYLSKEVGARYLVNHTPRASFCVCAEATAFRKGWVEAGKAFYKITVYGGPVLYTPYLSRPYPEGEHPNAIVRALPLIARLEDWALEYERRHTYESPGGTVVPRVNVSAIRGGQPWLVLQNPEVCMLYLDIRTVPGQDGGAIRHELRDLLDELGLEGRVEQFLDRPGYEAHGIEPLSDAIDAAHRYEFDEELRDRLAARVQHVARPQRVQRSRDPLAHLRPARRGRGGHLRGSQGGPAARLARVRADGARDVRRRLEADAEAHADPAPALADELGEQREQQNSGDHAPP